MLKSRCFTTTVTPSTAGRLARAMRNAPLISKRETHRGAVVAIQTALASLNKGYMQGAEIDGYFGSRTAAAVEAFQRDYGLIADGTVGAQTLAQLDEIFAGAGARPAIGVSLHVGVDKVDFAHYDSELALPSCVNDAREMERIAISLGYSANRLENEQATCVNVAAFLRNAAINLFAGDSFFFTYSGHGSQVPNETADAEIDYKDETLVLYDRMLIDDEIYALLGEFREGVRVHMVFDSCHSGTAFKMVMADSEANLDELVVPRERVREALLLPMKDLSMLVPGASSRIAEPSKSLLGTSPTGVLCSDITADKMRPILAKSLEGAALDGDNPETEEPQSPDPTLVEDTADLFADLRRMTDTGRPKYKEGEQFYKKNKVVYDAVRASVGSKELEPVHCTITVLSAAMDNQTTPAGSPLSLFTFNISQVWRSGSFSGDYTSFHQAILDRSRPDASPQLNAEGGMGAKARLAERPFSF